MTQLSCYHCSRKILDAEDDNAAAWDPALDCHRNYPGLISRPGYQAVFICTQCQTKYGGIDGHHNLEDRDHNPEGR